MEEPPLLLPSADAINFVFQRFFLMAAGFSKAFVNVPRRAKSIYPIKSFCRERLSSYRGGKYVGKGKYLQKNGEPSKNPKVRRFETFGKFHGKEKL